MRPHILIIGAGMAGLTAAITLAEGAEEAGLSARPQITILEADGIAGGRVRSETLSNGVPVDIGAHWFHGGRQNALFKWADARYKLGSTTLDTATKRRTASSGTAMPPAQREWALMRLYDLYTQWKAQHTEDISLADLAISARSPAIRMVAEERAINWMAVENARQVSADEYFGDDAGSGGMQLEAGMGSLIEHMVEEAEWYGIDIQLRTPVKEVIRNSGEGVTVIDAYDNTYEADLVLVTTSISVLKSGQIGFSDRVHEKLDPVLAGMTMARMTKIFVPLRPEFFDQHPVDTNTFVTFYDRHHSWLCHIRTGGKPIVTVFGAGGTAEIIETEFRNDLENQILELLERIPGLQGCSDHIDGRIKVTSWTTDPAFGGAYSAMLPGHKRQNPLHCGSVIFAGEAFVADLRKSPSQMVGAWYSGRTAAQTILTKLAKTK